MGPGQRWEGRLFHYTCDHGALGIRRDGEIHPGATLSSSPPDLGQRLPQTLFVWLTDLETPNRLALGLTSHTLKCDRTQHRFEVEVDDTILPWVRLRRFLPMLHHLERAPGALPMHWFLSPASLLVTSSVARPAR